MSTNVGPQDLMLLGTANSDGTFTGVTSGTSQYIPPNQHQTVAIVLVSNGTTSGGAITIEEAFWTDKQMPYGGTWSAILAVNASDLTGGAQKIVHVVGNNALFPVRVRISSNITGGGGISAALRYQ